MSIVFPETGTLSSTEEGWIRFEGTAEPHGTKIGLRPADDQFLILKLAKSDVRTSEDLVEIRLGGSILNLSAIKDDDPQVNTQVSSSRARVKCGGSGTACIGKVEFCCHNGEAVGSCNGYWRCP